MKLLLGKALTVRAGCSVNNVLNLLAGNNTPDKRNSKECSQAACRGCSFLHSVGAGAWHPQGSCLHYL